MREFVTPAFVLDFEKLREGDLYTWLYTRDLGLIKARVGSGQKVGSKLSPHLQGLSKVLVRLVDKNQLRLVDILPVERNNFDHENLIKKGKVFRLLKHFGHYLHPDLDFWKILGSTKPSSLELLAHSGFDVSLASCAECSSRVPSYFSTIDDSYYCALCATGIDSSDELHELF